jgi:hypothetical protein
VLLRLFRQLAGVDQERGAVGQEVQAGIAAPGAELMDVEHARLPGRDRLAHDVRAGSG